MKTSAVSRRFHSREPDVNSLELSSLTLPLQKASQQIDSSPLHLSVGQPARKSHRRDPEQQDITERSEPDAETCLLNERGASKEEIPNRHSAPARWNAVGFVGLCIIVPGTVVIVAATAFLAYLWQSSMRARAGQSQGSHGGLWDLIVLSNWTSVTVTLTAAVIRVCLALQMGVLTGMIASLLIEKSGVPMGAAPFVSILRAVSASPYHLVSRAALTTPFAIAVGLGVLLTGGSQFTSTALLFVFDLANITTPKQTVVLPYGSSQPENPSVDGLDSPVGTLRGSKIWNSQPETYFRFAEQNIPGPVPDVDVGVDVDDSGTTLRAILPFTSAVNRTKLRQYDGPAVVFDSRVACIRPVLQDLHLSIVDGGALYRRIHHFDEVLIGGRWSTPKEPTLVLETEYRRSLWPFNCVMLTPKAVEEAEYWPISICAALGGSSTWDSIFAEMPGLRSTVLPMSKDRSRSIFHVFNTTGSIESWGKHLLTNEIPENGNYLATHSLEQLNWTSSEEGTWVHLRPPPGSINASVSISTCFTNLPGLFQHVEMSSDQDGDEPGLSWDRVNARYETAPIRGQYENLGDNAAVRDSRGILALHPKTGWGFEEDESNMTETTKSRSWMPFSSVADGLPYMSLNGAQRGLEVLASGILVPGAYSPYAVHYAHAALFQDIAMTTGSLAQGLQGLLTVLRQMAYYEISPYFDMQSPASLILSNEELIPVRWTGFTVVVGMVLTHLVLLAVILVLFFKFTRLSWLGNVWISLSQVVSLETQDLIDKSTDKLDKEVDKAIKEETSRAGTGSTERVRIKRNDLRGRCEISY